MSDSFKLDPRLAAASLPLAETPLCLFRLIDDSRYPWVLLVPCRPHIVELFDLSAAERHTLVDQAADLAAAMTAIFAADKMNIGSLGNRVTQFHLHVIARRRGDAAWPDAVWNGTPAMPYEPAELAGVLGRLRDCLPVSKD